MSHLINTIAILIATLSTTIICMEETPSSHLFVLTQDKHIIPINKKNIPRIYALDVMAAHQHKDFSCITEEKKRENSYGNPLDASPIAGLTSEHLQLLDKALNESNSEKLFINFYSNLDDHERLTLFDAAIKTDTPIIR